MKAVFLAAFIGALGVASPAFAESGHTGFWEGLCADCVVPGATVLATLAMNDGLHGQDLSADIQNFAFFAYLSDKHTETGGLNLPIYSLSGSIDVPVASYEFDIKGVDFAESAITGAPSTFEFITHTDGDWFLLVDGIDQDHGTGSTWSPTPFATTNVPEPVTLSIFGIGALGAAALRRRKSKKA